MCIIYANKGVRSEFDITSLGFEGESERAGDRLQQRVDSTSPEILCGGANEVQQETGEGHVWKAKCRRVSRSDQLYLYRKLTKRDYKIDMNIL